MFDDYQICPYTGLRSFTEEESLYFKGREEHIEQATEQLQRNKFLMLTGASGDGKSSLVYAGIIPNARAGFLKSKYTQWCVADFRPERTPFKNLCRSVAKQLDIINPGTVESELQHGFSALADLYRNSKRFVDVDSVAWKQADDSGKAAVKREAANLIILVDQFEEFFTNPENYHQGVPSRDSNLVLNLLLETARITLEEDLPVYVVFTMRSDYIGQCAAFRSLPEYIGFSQFFVPRLNRSQLQQVIEEPASLSGNRISRRLTERLIHDIAEGVDQLPILQHALNQIWLAADNGKEEMDLIHYAMVGGMSSAELPDGQVERFVKWFDKLPQNIRQFYKEPNLKNVLDTHANKLYESAGENYRRKTGKTLTDDLAKEIIRTAFTCLTKIDQSRAVRNRMTLLEITHILGHTEIGTTEVGAVLNIFRDPGNTFIRPFITDEPESNSIANLAVLDITHESLIRNWEYLEDWAKEEFHDYTVSLDFEQQLNRWVESGKSNGFLLSIGPLTYFETWYNKVDPNAYWIARYLPEDIELDKKLSKAKQVLANAQDFLKRSARKHVVTRAFIRYGTKRIAAVVAVVALITLSSFAFRDYLNKQNSSVLQSIKEESLQLANNKKVTFVDKMALLCEELRLGEITLYDIVNSVEDPIERINVVGGVPMMLVFQGRDEPRDVIMKGLMVTDSLLGAYPTGELNSANLSGLLNEINDFGVTMDLAILYNHDARFNELRQKNARRGADWVLHIIKNQPVGFTDIRILSTVMENSLNRGGFTSDELDTLISTLSPFGGNKMSDWHQSNFKVDNLLPKGIFGYGIKFNGLYQELAYIYAAAGNSGMALQCIDSLLRYNSNYYTNDYASLLDNASNIASVFYLNGKAEELDVFVKGYCLRKKISEEEFYNRLSARYNNSDVIPGTLHLFPWMNYTANLNLRFTDADQISFFSEKYRDAVRSNTKSVDLMNFQIAVSYKNEGILKAIYTRGFNDEIDKTLIWPLFDKAFEHYKMVKSDVRELGVEVTLMSDVTKTLQKTFFTYPDFYPRYNPTEPRSRPTMHSSDSYINYILEKGHFSYLYNSDADLKNFSEWLLGYDGIIDFPASNFGREIEYRVLIQLEAQFVRQKASDKIDLNLLYFYLGEKSYALKDNEKAMYYYSQIKQENLITALKDNGGMFRLVAKAIINLTELDHFDEAHALIRVFKNNVNRSALYAFASAQRTRVKGNDSMVLRFLDSARVEMARTKDLTTWQPNRILLAYALAMSNPEKNQDEIYKVIKNVGGKSFAMMAICRSYAFNGKLYGGMQNIPANISDADRTVFLWNLVYGLQEGLDKTDVSWNQYEKGHRPWFIQWIPYVNDDE